MVFKLVTPPATEPITLADAKAHLRVEVTDDDTLISRLIVAARKHFEMVYARALITQTWDLFLDEFPDLAGDILVPRPPLQSVTSLKYTEADLTVTTFDASKYFVDTASRPGRIALQDGESWPSDKLRPKNGVEVRFVAGFGANPSDVPEEIVQGMLILIGHWYENREAVVVGTTATKIPMAAEALFAPHRNYVIG